MTQIKPTTPLSVVIRTPNKSGVDILIPFHGQYQKTMACVRSLLESTRGLKYRLCLIDDGSPNEKFIESLQKIKNVVGLRSSTQQGFGAALKLGFDNTSNPWVVFLNSDCIIQDSGWLLKLGNALLKLAPNNVKMVSAKSNNPGIGLNPALTSKTNIVSDHVVLESGEYLPLYCTLCHRELFSHIGGFVKAYPYGGYEDTELAYRMARHNFKQAVCGTSWVFHHGGATIEEVCKNNPKAVKIMESNRELCINDIKNMK